MHPVDMLGRMKAQIAALEEQYEYEAAKLRAAMIEAGKTRVEGKLFAATLSVSERCTVDVKKLRAVFPQEKHPQYYRSSIVESLRVSAR